MKLSTLQMTLFAAVALVLIGLNVMSLYVSQSQPSVRFVRSQEVVYGFLGMKEAQNDFELKRQGWTARLDTLQQDFQETLSQYTREVGSLSEQERSKREELLQVQRQNIARYNQQISQQISEEEERLLNGVLNQVNAFAQQYAEENGLDLVLGTTVDGSILYGSEGHDITDEFLTAMNEWYDAETVQ